MDRELLLFSEMDVCHGFSMWGSVGYISMESG